MFLLTCKRNEISNALVRKYLPSPACSCTEEAPSPSTARIPLPISIILPQNKKAWGNYTGTFPCHHQSKLWTTSKPLISSSGNARRAMWFCGRLFFVNGQEVQLCALGIISSSIHSWCVFSLQTIISCCCCINTPFFCIHVEPISSCMRACSDCCFFFLHKTLVLAIVC